MDCGLSGSSVHGIFQARVLEWPFPSPGDLPNPEIKPGSPTLQADASLSEPPGKPKERECQRMLKLPHNCTHGCFFSAEKLRNVNWLIQLWLKTEGQTWKPAYMWPPILWAIMVTSRKPLSMSRPRSCLPVLSYLGPMFMASISFMSGQKYVATLKIIFRWNPHSGFPWHVWRCCICTKWWFTDTERSSS